jgi:hypothetical protein
MAETFEWVPSRTKYTAVVRITYESGKIQDWTLGQLLDQRVALKNEIAKGVDLSADLAALELRITGVSNVVAHLPKELPPELDTPD